eukprot:6487514-Karenia_brevis.AAC.1
MAVVSQDVLIETLSILGDAEPPLDCLLQGLEYKALSLIDSNLHPNLVSLVEALAVSLEQI